MRTEVRTERKINFATFCPDPPIQASSWGGVGVSICDGDDFSSEGVEVQLQVRSFFYAPEQGDRRQFVLFLLSRK